MNVLAICAGVAGLELGIRIAEPGARGVCYVEREAYAAGILAARMEEGWLHPAPIWSDLGTFNPEPWRGVVHCIASGDPCQPNSVAGKRLGTEDDRWLLDRVLAIVEALRPDRFFRENVPGNADGQLAVIVPALEGMGYRVAAGIFSAAECGASHRRERLFIMAHAIGRKPPGWGARCREAASGRAYDQSSGSGFQLANARGAGWEGRERGGSSSEGNRPEASGSASQYGSASLVQPYGSEWRAGASAGCQPYGDGGRDEAPGRIGESKQTLCESLPVFAPGPADPSWPEIIREFPALEPAVCRMANGMAHRVDRLRAAGNGVVPLAAAYAYASLDAVLRQGGR